MPPTTRVVVDLERACRYELVPSTDHKVVLKLFSTATTAKLSPKPATPVSALVMKPAVASAKPAASPVTTASAKLDASASPFVFVEPSYMAKDAAEAAKPSVDSQPARAVEAATKFVDKPEGNLLPTPSAAPRPQEAAAAAPGSVPAVNMAA